MTPERTLGVVGTMVWDRIVGRGTPVEGWGGIAYALSALCGALPESWAVMPIVKVGSDLEDSAHAFLKSFSPIDSSAMRSVPEANNRVELRYVNTADRTEWLTGGVPSWEADELIRASVACDALLVNFISGHEMELETAQALRAAFSGPIYADLHSLFLGLEADGRRTPRTLESWDEWAACFDAIQMNAEEFSLMGLGEDPWLRAEAAIDGGVRIVAVTEGPLGASWMARKESRLDPSTWDRLAAHRGTARVVRGEVRLSSALSDGDPTGCGDVWGAVFFARMLMGDQVRKAAVEANRQASRNAAMSGVPVYHPP